MFSGTGDVLKISYIFVGSLPVCGRGCLRYSATAMRRELLPASTRGFESCASTVWFTHSIKRGNSQSYDGPIQSRPAPSSCSSLSCRLTAKTLDFAIFACCSVVPISPQPLCSTSSKGHVSPTRKSKTRSPSIPLPRTGLWQASWAVHSQYAEGQGHVLLLKLARLNDLNV